MLGPRTGNFRVCISGFKGFQGSRLRVFRVQRIALAGRKREERCARSSCHVETIYCSQIRATVDVLIALSLVLSLHSELRSTCCPALPCPALPCPALGDTPASGPVPQNLDTPCRPRSCPSYRNVYKPALLYVYRASSIGGPRGGSRGRMAGREGVVLVGLRED